MVKISIIVPVWNVYDYIGACLDSLINQSEKNLEVIVVNDGSPDNSQEIIDKYVEKYPNMVKSFIKENGGQGSARNLGIKHAKGKYLSFVDSDDFIDKDFIKKMVGLAEKDNADVVVCDMVDLYKDKKIYHDCTHFDSILKTTPSVCNKIFKRELFEGIEFKNKIWYEDLNVMLKLVSKIKKISVIHEGYYICNCRETSTMKNNNSEKNLDIITAIEDSKNYLKDKNDYNYVVFNHVLIETINRVSLQKNSQKREVIKKITKYCHENIPDYCNFPFYKNVSKNRKIIAWLNYHYLSSFSKLILGIKNVIKKG